VSNKTLTKAEKRELWLHAVDCANEALSGKNKGRTAYEDVYKLVVKQYLKWRGKL
jgi:hypothetical protein